MHDEDDQASGRNEKTSGHGAGPSPDHRSDHSPGPGPGPGPGSGNGNSNAEPPQTAGREDVVTMTFHCQDPRWATAVRLGDASHDLGEHETSSMAMNAAMKYYYEQRPQTRRRKGGSGTVAEAGSGQSGGRSRGAGGARKGRTRASGESGGR